MYKIFNPTLTIFSSLNQNLKINLQSYRFKKTKNKRKSNYKKNKLIKRFVARVEKKRRIRDKIVANQIFLEKFQAFNRNEYPEKIKRRIREYLPIIVRIYYFGTNRINLPKKEQKKTANKNFALDKKRTSLPKKEQKKTANKNFALDNKPRATFITITDEVSFPKPDYNRGPKWNIDMGESNLILRRLTNCSRGLPLVRNVSEKKTKDQRQEIVDKLIGERQTDLISEYCRQRKFENEIKTLYGSFGPQNELRKKYVLSILVLMQDLRIKKIEENLKSLLAQREAFSSFLDQEGRELIKAEGTVGAGVKFGFLLAEAEFCLKRFDFLGKKAEIWRKIVKEHGLNVKDRLVKIGKSKDWSVEINKFLDLLASLMKREINKDFKLAKKTRWHRDWNMLKAIRTAAHVLLLKDKRGNKEMYKEPLLCEDFEFLLKARWMEVIADALLLNDKRLIRKKETYKEPLLREDLEPQFIKIKGKTSKASSDEFSEHLYCLIGLKKANLSEALKARKSQVRLSLKKHREAKIKEAKKLKKKTLTKEKLKDRLEKKTENLSIALMKKKPRNKLGKKTLPVASSKVEKKAPSPEALIVLTNKKPRNELEKKTLPKSNAGKKAEILPATSSLKNKKPKNDLKKKVLTKKELRNELKKKALIRKKLKKKLEKARSKILTKSQLLKIKQLENIKKILETKRRKEIKRKQKAIKNKFLHTFVCNLMSSGKKSTAIRILMKSFIRMARRRQISPIKVFMRAVDDVKPYFNVRARRVGGSTFQVPYIIKDHRRRALAITWIIQAATMKKKKFPKKKFHRFLVEEVLESLVPKKKPRPNATKKNSTSKKSNPTKKNSTSKKSNPTKKNNANRENIIARLGLEK